MKSKSQHKFGLGATLLFCAALAASADTVVTFNVDMSVASTNGTFDPNTQTMAVRGNFSGWGTAMVALTNDATGPNPALWSGATNLPPNWPVIAYKYVIETGDTYESSHNRLLTVPASGSIVAPVAYFNDTPPSDTLPFPVTFQVNLAQQINTGAFIPGTSSVFARGSFNGWATDFAMTNDPSILVTNQYGLVTSNVYVYTYDVTGSPGQTVDYKYYIDTGANWESPAPGTGDPNDNNNRFYNLVSGAQRTPLLYFNDNPYAPVATVDVTFQVDMSAQVLNGAFDPTIGIVEVRGNFNGWGTPQIICTNDPAAVNTNLYSAVVRITDGVGVTDQYKFWGTGLPNSGWETLADNRTFVLGSGPTQVLPKVYFNNQSPSDFLSAETLVTFTVNMTNAVGTDSHAFDPSAGDKVYLNGIPSFVGWDPTSLAPFELTNNPVGSRLYTLPLLRPKGSPIQVTYKYSINGGDNEAGTGQNHVRYIRAVGTYTMPMDTFGNQYVEPSFGNLQASPSTAGHVLISWLGRPGVNLQTSTDLTRWLDHPETDGLSSTNWPSSGGPLFFRLIKPGL